MYSPLGQHVAQSGGLFLHRLVTGMMRKVWFVRGENLKNVPEWGPYRGYSLGYCQPTHRWCSPLRWCSARSSIRMPEWVIRVQKVTPEESDDCRSPHENPPKCHIPDGNNRLFSHLFSLPEGGYSDRFCTFMTERRVLSGPALASCPTVRRVDIPAFGPSEQ